MVVISLTSIQLDFFWSCPLLAIGMNAGYFLGKTFVFQIATGSDLQNKNCQRKMISSFPFCLKQGCVFPLSCLSATAVSGRWMIVLVKTADHHTSSHMPTSMMDGCSLSWTKWKVHASESDKGFICLPDKCVSLMCSSPFTCTESLPLPLQGVLVEHALSNRQRLNPMWLQTKLNLCHMAFDAACAQKYI